MKLFINIIFIIILSINSTFAKEALSKEFEQSSNNANKILDSFSIELLINIIFAIIAILITVVISKVINSKISSFFEKSGNGENREELVGVMTRTTNIAVLSIGFAVVLSILGIDMGIFLGGLGFGLGFTLKIFLSNFVAGIIMVTQGSYHNGDIIKIGDRIGKIIKINSLFTEVEQFNGIIFFVPNIKFLETEVENFHINDKRRIEINIGVDFDTDLLKAKKIMLQVVNNFPGILKSPDPIVYINKFSDSSIDLSLRFWINSKGNYFSIKSNVTETINLAFKKYGIIIPFPQITISNRENNNKKV